MNCTEACSNIFEMTCSRPTISFPTARENRGRCVVTTSVPTTLQRAGDFSQTFASNGQLVNIFDPTTTVPDPAHPGQYVRTAFVGNRIPQSRLDPVALKIESYYPQST